MCFKMENKIDAVPLFKGEFKFEGSLSEIFENINQGINYD